MDYLVTDDSIDKNHVAVIGHSRLGKTALWCGGQDERFALTISNNSGAGGAALFRIKVGERAADLIKNIPYWFCDNFKPFAEKEQELPVDQHMLLSLSAPRMLYVASAADDEWADPNAEFLSLCLSNEVFKDEAFNALTSFLSSSLKDVLNNRTYETINLPDLDRPIFGNKLGYHVKTGEHSLSRIDWELYADFFESH